MLSFVKFCQDEIGVADLYMALKLKIVVKVMNQHGTNDSNFIAILDINFKIVMM